MRFVKIYLVYKCRRPVSWHIKPDKFSRTLTEPTAYDIITSTVWACTGFDRPAEDGEAIRGL